MLVSCEETGATKRVSNSFSSGTPEGDKDLACYGRGLDLLTLSAAGAFLHGVEDEFSEVVMGFVFPYDLLHEFFSLYCCKTGAQCTISYNS